MIDSYEIIKQNNEEVLYIYLDINSEFAKSISYKKNIKSIIKDFINKNKITFTGTLVVVAIGTLVIGNYYFKKNEINDLNSSISVTKLLLNKNDNIEIKDLSSEINSDFKENEKAEEKRQTIETKRQNILDKKVETNVSLLTDDIIKEANQEKIDNNVYVTIRRSNGDIVTLELEEYIIGVVSAEMPAEFNEEALKAQAILARTYTLKALLKKQTLGDNEATQSYKDQNQLRNLWGNKFAVYYNKIKNCVLSTKGITLKYNGNYIEAVYHSTSNGMTENAVNVWGNTFPYLISVESPYDSFNKSFLIEKNITYSEISSKLGININQETEFIILEKTESGRVKNIEVNNQIFTGVNFRNKLGLRSTDFEISKIDEGIIIKTRGYGHGVGMSQYGANGMASLGYNYEHILFHYYPGTTLDYQ